MPEPVQNPAQTPETSTPEPVVAAVATPEAPPTPSPLTTRQEVIQKYNSLYAQPTPEPPVVTQPAPQVIEPAADPGEDRLAALERENTELRARLATPAPAPPPAADPAAAKETPPWVKALVEGRWDEFINGLGEQLSPRLAKDWVPQAVKHSSEAIHAETEISTFVEKVRRENPDILSMENYIASAVDRQLQDELNAGKIAGPSAFSERYKAVLNKEVENAKKIVASLRGAGKAEGLGTKQEILHSSVIPPSKLDANRETNVAPQGPPTLEDYFAKRRAKAAVSRGLSG